MIESIANFLNNTWNPYGIVIVALFMVAFLYIQTTPFRKFMKPGKKNQKVVWTCPECKVNGTMYFREYGYLDDISIAHAHTETSPYCDGKGFDFKVSDMTANEIQQQNKSARERNSQ